jgi:hypothetical protein
MTTTSSTIQVTPSQLETLLHFCVDQRQPVFVWGPPGIGKSEIINKVLHARFGAVENFYALLHDPSDIKGFIIPDRERGVATWLKPEFFARGVPTGFFVDELSNAPALVKNALLQLALFPDTYLPAGSFVVAAGNRPQDKTGSSALGSALANRFAPHVELVPSVDDWSRWAIQEGSVAPVVIAYARFQPDAIEGTPNLSDRAYCTPRSLTRVGRMVAAGIPPSVQAQLICGTIGDMHGVQLAEFLRIWQSMPNLDMIIASPAAASVPTDRGVLFALIQGLAVKARMETFDSIVEYALRLPPEFATTLVTDCVARDQSLQATSGFIRYAANLPSAS